MPYVIEKTVSNIGAVATPLGLMALGASFDVQKALGKIKPVIAACMLKLVGFTAVFLPFAVMLGFRRESCYVMAKNMGHEGTLTSGVVMLTTVFSAFTLTGWLFILKSMNLV